MSSLNSIFGEFSRRNSVSRNRYGLSRWFQRRATRQACRPSSESSSASAPRLRYAGSSMDIVTGHLGWIEVISGPMFSGKSEELIRRLRRARIARKRVQVFGSRRPLLRR